MKTSRTFSIHFWLKKTAKKNNGLTPIYARITVDGIRADISTKRATYVQNWSYEASRIKSRISNAKLINEYLDDIYSKLLDCHKQLHAENSLITAQAIKLRYLGKDKRVSSLNELVKYHRDEFLPKLKQGTAKNYSATEKYLSGFIKKQYNLFDFKLDSIDYSFVINFENYLRTCPSLRKCQPLNNNGVMKHMERFQKIIGIAYKSNWIKQNPFVFYKLKFEKFDNQFLYEGELQLFESFISKDSGIQLVCDLFVFSCYTGLSYIEVKQLKISDIINGVDGDEWISVTREKTSVPVKIPILEPTRKILKKYSGHYNIKNNNLLLPVCSNQKINGHLKIIAKKLDINKNLTFHVARHTFATTVTLLNDIPIETVSKLLGHKNIKTTMKYARVIEKKISKDMKQLKEKLKVSAKNKANHSKGTYGHLRVIH